MDAELLDRLSFSELADRQLFLGLSASLGPAAVRVLLWKVFRLAVNGGLEDELLDVSAKDVAAVFDQLIDLSELVVRLKLEEAV